MKMEIEIIKNQAKKWAELFVSSEEAFTNDFKNTVDMGRFEPAELNVIVNLAQVYANYLTKQETREKTLCSQEDLLREYLTERGQSNVYQNKRMRRN